MDQITLQAFMDILKVLNNGLCTQCCSTILQGYVEDSYFPTLEEVVNFKLSYWEEQLFQQGGCNKFDIHFLSIQLFQRIVGDNALANLKPQGMISMRLGNPKKSSLFDRCQRTIHNGAGVKGISHQSSALKYQQIQFKKLGPLLLGDLIELEDDCNIAAPGGRNLQFAVFFHVRSFFKKKF